MPEEKRSDDVDKLLTEQKSLEARKKALIDDLLGQREAALKSFDEKLAQLGYHANAISTKSRRSHHSKKAAKPAAPPPAETKSQRPARPSERPRGQEPSRSRQGE
jgi:hypothetical protein